MVSTERLIEQLFGRARPGSADQRRSRGGVPAAPGARATSAPRCCSRAAAGTLLELEPDQLDAATFERLVDEAARLAGSRRPGGGVGTAARGARPVARPAACRPRAPSSELQAEIRRLEELRLLAEMERIDAELALRPRGRGRRRAGAADRGGAAAGATARPADARALPLWPPGRGARRLPRGVRAPARRARADAERGAQELERMILRQDAGLDAERARGTRRPSPVRVPVQGAGRVRELRRGVLLSAATGSSPSWSRGWRSGRWWASSARRASASPRCCARGAAGAAGRRACRAARGWRQVLAATRQASMRRARARAGRRPRTAPARSSARGERIVVAVDQLEELVHGLRGRLRAARVPRTARGARRRPRTARACAVHVARRLLRPAERVPAVCRAAQPQPCAGRVRWIATSSGRRSNSRPRAPGSRSSTQLVDVLVDRGGRRAGSAAAAFDDPARAVAGARRAGAPSRRTTARPEACAAGSPGSPKRPTRGCPSPNSAVARDLLLRLADVGEGAPGAPPGAAAEIQRSSTARSGCWPR